MKRVLLGLLLSAVVCTRTPAQAFGGSEIVAGAALNVALRGPYVAPSWRRPIPRFVLGQAISLTYECTIDANGCSWPDMRDRLSGYVLTEAVVALGRLAFRHH